MLELISVIQQLVFESALIMIRSNTAMLILPMLASTVVPGIAKVPLLGCTPVDMEIAWMKNDARLEVMEMVEIAKELYKRNIQD